MKRVLSLLTAVAAFVGLPSLLPAQDFGLRTTELKEVGGFEAAKPNINDLLVGDPISPGPVIRPIYLVYRYYSCSPWYRFYIRDVYTSVVSRDQYHVEIDAADNIGDDVERQIVTDINHPAYGLYCLTVRIGVPWSAWVHGAWHRWYILWAYRSPYWCWQDHWWYYWRRPQVPVSLSGAQEVPVVPTPATGSATITHLGGGNIHYTLSWSGLTTGATVAHFHAPAGPGQNNSPLVTIPGVTGTAGTVTGTVNNLILANHLATQTAPGQSAVYINIHTSTFPGGEIRGQVPLLIYNPVWCPWGPTWWPYTRWTRVGIIWGLTLTHPYCYAWDPFYIPRPFCIYGLRYFFTPIGNVRSPVVATNSPAAIPVNRLLHSASLATRPWSIYNTVSIGGLVLRPPYYYWPFTPYCQRWYWFRCPPFSLYRYNPPVVQYAVWQNPGPNPVNTNFPDEPIQELPGTIGVATARALVSQHGDLTGDGLVNFADQAAYKAENGTEGIDSFFDVFTELE